MAQQTQAEFDALVANAQVDAQDIYENAEEFNDWFPPDGDYSVIAGEPNYTNITTKEGGKLLGKLTVPLTVLEGTEESNELLWQCWGNNKVDQAVAKGLYELLTGTEAPANYTECMRGIFQNVEGQAFTVNCKTVPGKKEGAFFHNLKFLDICADAEAPAS